MSFVAKLPLAYKLTAGTVTLGFLSSAITGALMFANLRSAGGPGLLESLATPILVAIVFLAVVTLLFAHVAMRPIRQIRAAAEGLAAHDPNVQFPPLDLGGDVGRIARSLRTLSQAETRPETGGNTVIDAIDASQCVVELDAGGLVVAANANMLALLDQSNEEIRSRHYSRLFASASEDGQGIRTCWEGVKGGAAVPVLFKLGTLPSQPVFLQGSFVPVASEQGSLERVFFIASETTNYRPRPAISTTDATAGGTNDLAEAVDGLRSSLAALASGDTTSRISATFPEQHAALKTSFNQAVERLENALAQITQIAGSLQDRAVQISDASDELSGRTENQAAALEQTAAALEQLTSSVQGAADGAESASGDALATKESAEEGDRIVGDAVAAMGEIEASSERISKIISVIDDISFQTNLLALNAGVEAARAGDAGRGFAVVASEVRALAQRSSEAAREIKALISESSRQVSRGVGLVRQTGDSLRGIVDSVSRVAGLVQDIANSSREQSLGLTEINTAVNELDQVTQQNTAMVEQFSQTSHAIKTEAEDLASTVKRFKTRPAKPAAGQGRTPAAAPARKPAPAPKPAASPAASSSAPAKAAQPAPAPKPAAAPPAPVPASDGSAALAIQPRDPLDDWEDF